MSLHKLVQKVILTIIFMGTPTIMAGEPIKMSLDGTNQTQVGKVVRISIDSLKGINDPKIMCLPENDSWEAVQKLNGDPILLFFPEKEGLYTFIVVGNKDNKTIFGSIQVQVGNSPPVPPQPGPVVEGKYTQTLKAPYLVSPNDQSLTKLIAVYQAMSDNSGSITSYKQMADALAAATKGAIGDLDLRGVRDAVALILQTDLANRNSTTYDASATKNIFLELVKSLKPLLGSK